MTGSRIPVVVLAGFLGAGKTTLLNHLLRNRQGVRIGAVVNDFGSVPVDALTVAGQVDALASFENGCLCCAADPEDLDLALARLAAPGTGIDLIVVEASGLAEPPALVRAVLASREPRTVYGGLVLVVDAAEYEATLERHPGTARHLRAADLVVLNKTDRRPAAERDALLARLRGSTPAPVVPAAHGRVDPGLFFDGTAPAGPRGPVQLSFADLVEDTGPSHPHLHAGYDSVAFTTAAPLAPRALTTFLRTRPAGLYRVKGAVAFGPGPDHRFTLHAVGRFLRFQPDPGGDGTTRLVLIGAGIDGEALRKELAACTAPTPATERDLWEVLRFVDAPGEAEDPA